MTTLRTRRQTVDELRSARRFALHAMSWLDDGRGPIDLASAQACMDHAVFALQRAQSDILHIANQQGLVEVHAGTDTIVGPGEAW